MTAETSKEILRRNPVAVWIGATINFVRANRTGVLVFIAIALAGGLSYAGYEWYHERREAEARQALITAGARLRAGKPGETVNRDDAMKLLQEVASSHPGTVAAEEALVRLGNFQYEAQKTDEALATYAKYLQEYPRGRYRMMMAISKAYAEEGKGKSEEAIKTLAEITTASKDDPLVGEALLNLGRLYESQKKIDEAMKIYGQLSERYVNTQWGQIALQRMSALRTR
jgi:predicted negative regulator of RcsB-dependent stress response